MQNGSVLNTIKHLLGIESEYTHFDSDIIVHINSALSTLYQLGVNDFPTMITGSQETWEDLFGSSENVESIKTWIFIKVKLVFDPPMNSFTVDALNKEAKELEWRINVAVDTD